MKRKPQGVSPAVFLFACLGLKADRGVDAKLLDIASEAALYGVSIGDIHCLSIETCQSYL